MTAFAWMLTTLSMILSFALGVSGTYDGPGIMAIRRPVEELHRLVVNLICTTMPGISVVYSNESRWKSNPPEV
jgi:hypothetical protein